MVLESSSATVLANSTRDLSASESCNIQLFVGGNMPFTET